jgi:hypothetical protein
MLAFTFVMTAGPSHTFPSLVVVLLSLGLIYVPQPMQRAKRFVAAVVIAIALAGMGIAYADDGIPVDTKAMRDYCATLSQWDPTYWYLNCWAY